MYLLDNFIFLKKNYRVVQFEHYYISIKLRTEKQLVIAWYFHYIKFSFSFLLNKKISRK